jgi:hypothetical protein
LLGENEELAESVVSGIPAAAEGSCQSPKHVVGKKFFTSPFAKKPLRAKKVPVMNKRTISVNIHG